MKAIEDLNWELHLRVYSVKNSNGEPRRLIDFTVSNTEESSNVILTKLDNQGFKRTLRMFDHLKVYVYFRPINHQWVDIEESAFFKCYVNEMTFADLPKIGLSEDKSSLLYAELKKKDYLQGMKKSYKSGFMGSKDAVSNGKLPSAYFVKPVDIEDDNFAKICNKYEIDNNLRIQICEYIMDGQEHSRSNFRYLIAANMPGLKLESQDVNIAGKLNEFTCKIMTGAGKIELSEAKGEKFKYQTKDNNAIIQGYSCGRHTEKEVDAYYDFITQNGCNHTIEDFSYALSILDEASCGRRNRSYWIKAIIEGLMDASLKDRHQPLYVLLKNEYGKVRAKELLSLDPSMIDHAYDKVRNEIERLAQIKFGPVKASTIVTTIVKMATGLG